MTSTEKLLEIFWAANETLKDYEGSDEDAVKLLAEYTTEHGAIVPPFDVGDKVWYIYGGYYNSANMKPKEIEITEINKKKSGKTIEWGFIAGNTRYKFTSLGKTVFFTKVECEAAIEKRKKSSRKFT